ncbi:Mesaconyl-C(4)-CoA hydratase [Colletotrichum sp. SAR 10_77]|nr:Mesaconyl-C(4)-CoA hydratase [Colletotrichum sp. SAR 10_77]
MCHLGLKEIQNYWRINNNVLDLFLQYLDKPIAKRIYNEDADAAATDGVSGSTAGPSPFNTASTPQNLSTDTVEQSRSDAIEDQYFSLMQTNWEGEHALGDLGLFLDPQLYANGVESELGMDGTDKTFNAPAPFTRRMWAGGKMQFIEGTSLKVGEEVEERTRLVGATPKKSRSGDEMVLVDVEKEFWGRDGLVVKDQRSWIFRPEVNVSLAAKTAPPRANRQPSFGPSTITDEKGSDGGVLRHLRWSPVGLFRFSALTFNGHMIHYNEPWTKDIERHPEVVVHGPLNLINMLDYWRDVHGQDDRKVRQVGYRAMSPLYAGDEYTIRTASVEDDKKYEVLVEKGSTVCMKGEIIGS